MQGRRPCEDTARDWRFAVTSQGSLRIVDNNQRLEKIMKGSTQGLRRSMALLVP
jgi:hypothetical protein